MERLFVIRKWDVRDMPVLFQIGFLGTWWFSRCPDSVPKTIVWASLAFYPGVLSSSCTPPGPPPSTPTSGGSPSTPLSESDFWSESDDELHMEDVCKADPIPGTYVMAGLFERFVSRTARSTTRCPSTIHTSTSWSWRICGEDGWQYSKDGAKTYIIFTQKQCSFDCGKVVVCAGPTPTAAAAGGALHVRAADPCRVWSLVLRCVWLISDRRKFSWETSNIRTTSQSKGIESKRIKK